MEILYLVLPRMRAKTKELIEQHFGDGLGKFDIEATFSMPASRNMARQGGERIPMEYFSLSPAPTQALPGHECGGRKLLVNVWAPCFQVFAS